MGGTMSANDYKNALYESILHLLWRQWVSIGVAGHAAPVRNDYSIDPESLILISSKFCRYDQRLFDAVADWLLKYGQLVNPTRIKALQRGFHHCDLSSLAYLASLQTEGGDKRWIQLAKKGKSGNEGLLAMFLTSDGEAISHCPEKDPLALEYGFIRPRYIAKNKVTGRLPENTATLQLRLRGLTGVSARSDIMHQLMISPRSIQQLVNYCGFARNPINDVIKELQLANIVTQVSSSGRNAVFVLSDADKLKIFFKCTDCRPIHWLSIYESLSCVWELVSNPALSRLSDATFQGELHLLFREELQSNLLNCGISELEQLTEERIAELPQLLYHI